MTEPTLSVDYMDLVRVVARQMGYGSTYSSGTVTKTGTTITLSTGSTFPSWAGNAAINIGGTIFGINSRTDDNNLVADAVGDVGAATEYVLVQSITDDKADTFRDIQDVIDQAYQELCFPAPSDESYFIWSWLLERASISFEDNVANYDLPPNFGQFIDTAITYKAGLDLPSVTLLSQKEYRGEQSRDDSAGVPKYLMWRQKSFTATTGRRFEAALYPTPVSDQFADPEYSTGTLTSAEETTHAVLNSSGISATDTTATVSPGALFTTDDIFILDQEAIKVTDTATTDSVESVSITFDPSLTIASTSDANPAVVTTPTAHGLTTGDIVTIADTDEIDGADQVVTVTGATTFTVANTGAGTTGVGTVKKHGVLTITATAHSFVDGDVVTVSGVEGTTNVNGSGFTVAGKTDNTFNLANTVGQGVATSSTGTVTTTARFLTTISIARNELGTAAASHAASAELYKQGPGKRILLTGGTVPSTPATLIIPGGAGVADNISAIPSRVSGSIFTIADTRTLSETASWTIRHNITTFSRDASGTFDGAHLEYLFRVVPDALNPTNKYPLCGSIHGDTLMKACQAVAERKLGDDAGIYEAKFKERLAASIAVDRAVKATMGI